MPALEQDISDTLEYGEDTLTDNKCQDEPKKESTTRPRRTDIHDQCQDEPKIRAQLDQKELI
jgi:hypothetical protein